MRDAPGAAQPPSGEQYGAEGRAPAQQDFYEVLGVCADAPAAEIRAAYRRMALLTHPDKGGNGEQFRLVVIAFETLSSDRLRAGYDRQRFKEAGDAHARAPRSRKRGRPQVRKPAETGQADLAAARRGVARFLQALQYIISLVPRERRGAAIEGLPAAVRQRLLSFMQGQQPAPSGGGLPSAGSAACSGKEAGGGDTDESSRSDVSEAEMLALVDGEASPRKTPPPCGGTQGNRHSSKFRTSTGLRGVLRRSKNSFYAVTSIKGFGMAIQCGSLDDAVDMHASLMLLRAHVDSSLSRGLAFDVSMSRGLAALAFEGCDLLSRPKALFLRIHARLWTGNDILFYMGDAWDATMNLRMRMWMYRTNWSECKMEYAEMLVRRGRRGRRGCVSLAEAEAMIDEGFYRQEPKRVAKAGQRVLTALRAEEKAQRAMERLAAHAEAEHWRELQEHATQVRRGAAHLTMEQILAKAAAPKG